MLFVVVIAAALVSGLDPADETPPPLPVEAAVDPAGDPAVDPAGDPAVDPAGDPAGGTVPVVPVVPAVPAVVAPAPARDPASFDDEEFDEGGRSVATIPAPVRAPASVRSDARPVAAADPWRDAVVVGAAAAASGCLAGCTPLGCVGVCPPLVCASPVLACGGAVAGGVSTHTALHDDDDQQPFIIGAIAAAGILVGGMVGGGLGVVWGAATSTDQLTNAGVGALIGTSTLGVVLAGVGVAVAELWVVDARPAARPAGEAE